MTISKNELILVVEQADAEQFEAGMSELLLAALLRGRSGSSIGCGKKQMGLYRGGPTSRCVHKLLREMISASPMTIPVQCLPCAKGMGRVPEDSA